MEKAKTGIKVVIVGAGFGGLTAAIECHRQGHDVEIYESFPELKSLGDIISFGSNAGRIFYRWKDGEIAQRLRAVSIDLRAYGFRIHKWDTGEVVYHQKTPPPSPDAPVFNGHRGELHQIIFEYARDELKIPIHLGNHVEQYFEDDNQAGIVLKGGEKVSCLPSYQLAPNPGSEGADKRALLPDTRLRRMLSLGRMGFAPRPGSLCWATWTNRRAVVMPSGERGFPIPT